MQLPDSLKNKTYEELEKNCEQIKVKNVVRYKKKLLNLTTQRDAYIAAEKAKNAANTNNAATLETEVEKIIKEQARRYQMEID